VAKSASGKWVSRVGATGGGKAYKKTRPANYYGVLALIVILGMLSAVWARYEYQHPAKAVHATAPAIGTTWYAGLSIQACGQTLPYLTPDPTTSGGFTVQADNVIKVSPKTAADSGNNATVSQFSDEFPGLTASSGELAIPNSKGAADAATTYRNGRRTDREDRVRLLVDDLPDEAQDHHEPGGDQVRRVHARDHGLRTDRRDADGAEHRDR
jgi:hypothetical protein